MTSTGPSPLWSLRASQACCRRMRTDDSGSPTTGSRTRTTPAPSRGSSSDLLGPQEGPTQRRTISLDLHIRQGSEVAMRKLIASISGILIAASMVVGTATAAPKQQHVEGTI